ncbi:uncharacterized protein LOC62_02G003444 [Vanrija pseudolonga]|uniref:ABM domain-containing protein n=1 Tax=Vanrija pseudolonga TaxID=143232 RepID=A0AAF0Y4I5_9TREE|nr:hypothetical protein LOC62_02G003444 [Vanrija pseudolonga]
MHAPYHKTTNIMTVTLIATFRVVDEAAASRVQELLSKVRDVALSPAEPGTQVYNPARKTTDGLDFVVYEEYADKAAVDAHLSSDEFKALIGESETLLVGGRAGLNVNYYAKF